MKWKWQKDELYHIICICLRWMDTLESFSGNISKGGNLYKLNLLPLYWHVIPSEQYYLTWNFFWNEQVASIQLKHYLNSLILYKKKSAACRWQKHKTIFKTQEKIVFPSFWFTFNTIGVSNCQCFYVFVLLFFYELSFAWLYYNPPAWLAWFHWFLYLEKTGSQCILRKRHWNVW